MKSVWDLHNAITNREFLPLQSHFRILTNVELRALLSIHSYWSI